MNTSKDYTISAVQKALKILKLFDENHFEMSLSEISAMAGVGKSSTLRLLYTLASEGFIEFDEKNKTYSLGLVPLHLSILKKNHLDVRKIAVPYLQEISDTKDVICYLGIQREDKVLMIECVVPRIAPSWAQLMIRPGGMRELYSTGIGRLFLSRMPEEELKEYLNHVQVEQFTDKTVTDKTKLHELIKKAGKEGYSFNDGENEPYISSVCAPVFDYNKDMVAGISICGIQELIDGERREELIQDIIRTAGRISARLGCPV